MIKASRQTITIVCIVVAIVLVVSSVSIGLAYWSQQIKADTSFSDDADYNASERDLIFQPLDSNRELINFQAYDPSIHGSLEYSSLTDTEVMLYYSGNSGQTGTMATHEQIKGAKESGSYNGLYVSGVPVKYSQSLHGSLRYSSYTSSGMQIYSHEDMPAGDEDIASYFKGESYSYLVYDNGYVSYDPASSGDVKKYGYLYYNSETETDMETGYELRVLIDGSYMVITRSTCPKLDELYVTTFVQYDPIYNGQIVHSKQTSLGYTLYYSEDYVESGQVMSIAVTRAPYQTQYAVNEPLNTTGLIVTATYEDSSERTVYGYTCSGYTTADLGQATVTVTYRGKTASFNIEIVNFNYIYFDCLDGDWWYEDEAITKCKLTFTDGSSDTEELLGEVMSKQDSGLNLFYTRYADSKTVSSIVINRINPANENVVWAEAVSLADNQYSLENNLLRLTGGSSAEWVQYASEKDYIYMDVGSDRKELGASDSGWLQDGAAVYCYVVYDGDEENAPFPGERMEEKSISAENSILRLYVGTKAITKVTFVRCSPQNPELEENQYNRTGELVFDRDYNIFSFTDYNSFSSFSYEWLDIDGNPRLSEAGGEGEASVTGKCTLTEFHVALENEIVEGYNLYVGGNIVAFAVVGYSGTVSDVIIPDTHKPDNLAKEYDVVMIGASPDYPNQSMGGNALITSLVIGANVDTIADAAFRGMDNLVKVTVNGVGRLELGRYCFAACSKLGLVSSGKTLYDYEGKMITNDNARNNAFFACINVIIEE